MTTATLPGELAGLTPKLTRTEAVAWPVAPNGEEITPPPTPGWTVWQNAQRQVFAYWPGEPEAVAHLQRGEQHFMLYALWNDRTEVPDNLPAPSAARSLALVQITAPDAETITALLRRDCPHPPGSNEEHQDWSDRHERVWALLAGQQTRLLRHLQWGQIHLFWDQRFARASLSPLAGQFGRAT